jgi:hypothetical protein
MLCDVRLIRDDKLLLSLRVKWVAPRLAVSLACFQRSRLEICSLACCCATWRAFVLRLFRMSISQSEHVNTASNVIVNTTCNPKKNYSLISPITKGLKRKLDYTDVCVGVCVKPFGRGENHTL